MADESKPPSDPALHGVRKTAEQIYEFAEQMTVGESRWPAAVAILGTIVLHLSLPERLTVAQNWVFPVLMAALLVPLMIATPRRRAGSARWTRVLSLVLLAALAIANFASIGLLVHAILSGQVGVGDARKLIWSAISLWLTNVVVFGLAYWELDCGGPETRLERYPARLDFLFPQLTAPEVCEETWRPVFIDYLYVSFTNSTAFSPTDTMPLTPRVKLLMGFQSGVSLLVVALVAARAVNILG